MKKANEIEPLIISRSFAAPRGLVFHAWSRAEHMKRWFSPQSYTVPEAEIDFRVGGVFAICMRSAGGQDSWTKGNFTEITPIERLAFTAENVVDGSRKFTVFTTVTFEDGEAGSRMTVRQNYEVHDETFMFAIKGAPEGWRTALDKLEAEVARIQAAGRSAVHDSFTLERVYAAAPAIVFHALTDYAAKARWFTGGEDHNIIKREMDVRAGGREFLQGRWANGTVSTFDAVYFDVVFNKRLVYAYEMHIDDRKISVSLATVELAPLGDGTRLKVTEQGVFLNGYEDGGSREHGTGFLLDQLGASLQV